MLRNVLKVAHFKCYLMQVVYQTHLFQLKPEQVVMSEVFISNSFLFPALKEMKWYWCWPIIWVICCRWGGETDRAVISDLQTVTHNSTCALVAEAVTAHGLFRAHRALWEPPASQEVWPRLKTKEALLWPPPNKGVLGKQPSPCSLPPAPPFQPWRDDLLADGVFCILAATVGYLKNLGLEQLCQHLCGKSVDLTHRKKSLYVMPLVSGDSLCVVS